MGVLNVKPVIPDIVPVYSVVPVLIEPEDSVDVSSVVIVTEVIVGACLVLLSAVIIEMVVPSLAVISVFIVPLEYVLVQSFWLVPSDDVLNVD